MASDDSILRNSTGQRPVVHRQHRMKSVTTTIIEIYYLYFIRHNNMVCSYLAGARVHTHTHTRHGACHLVFMHVHVNICVQCRLHCFNTYAHTRTSSLRYDSESEKMSLVAMATDVSLIAKLSVFPSVTIGTIHNIIASECM